MLILIPILTFVIFAAIYPLCFWISYKDPLKDGFLYFHIGLANFFSGLAMVILFFILPLQIWLIVLGWKTIFFVISNRAWRRKYVDPRVMTVPCLLGIAVFCLINHHLTGAGVLANLSSILGGFVLCSAVFAMNLGHWYLNVHGLPIKHLSNAVKVFTFFLLTRLLWDAFFLWNGRIVYDGSTIRLYEFIGKMDGFLLLIGLFFGTLFPLISMYFVDGTIKVKSTQSATGILYVVLSAVLIGDITYKYYLLKFGVAL